MSQMTLVKFLQCKIAEYVEGKKYQSLMTLSDRSGVPYNTIRRIANGQVDKPTLETVLAVLRVVENRQGVIHSVKQYYPELGELFSATQTASETQAVTDYLIDSLFQDQVNYRIFSLAGTRAGTNRQDIQRMFGENGITKLNGMLDEEVLCEDGTGTIRTVVREYYSVDIRTILQKIRHCVDIYDTSLVGTDGCFLSTHSESLNIQGLKAVKKAAMDFYFAVAKIKNDERYSGSIPFYANVMLGLFDSSKLEDCTKHH
ncbi:MAG: hypothetical protein ACOH5I_18650 [Oligoflexus sp.]